MRVQGNFIGQYVLALHQWHDEFIQISVVCADPKSDKCGSLVETVLFRLPHPRRIVKVQEPGYYPDREGAALFICNSSACSTPMTWDDDALEDKAKAYFKVLDRLAG